MAIYDTICVKVGIAPIEEKMLQSRLRWFLYVHWQPVDILTRVYEKIFDDEMGGRRRARNGLKKS